MNKDVVFMITQLDSEYGYAIGRRVFILKSNDNYGKMLGKVATDKNVQGMLTTSREVLWT